MARQLSAKRPKDLRFTVSELLGYMGRHRFLLFTVAAVSYTHLFWMETHNGKTPPPGCGTSAPHRALRHRCRLFMRKPRWAGTPVREAGLFCQAGVSSKTFM